MGPKIIVFLIFLSAVCAELPQATDVPTVKTGSTTEATAPDSTTKVPDFGTEVHASIPEVPISPRIIGGTEVTEAEAGHYKYQVLVQAHIPHVGSKICSGFIVNEDYILTAAHCIEGVTQVNVTHGLDPATGTVVDVSSSMTLDSGNDYDVALLQLTTKLTWTDTLGPIDITSTDVKEGTDCTISGYGPTSLPGENEEVKPGPLHKLDVKIRPREVCNLEPSYGNVICASADVPENTLCTYDGGVPLVCDDALAGIAFKVQDCTTAFGIYQNITIVRDWIMEHSTSSAPSILLSHLILLFTFAVIFKTLRL